MLKKIFKKIIHPLALTLALGGNIAKANEDPEVFNYYLNNQTQQVQMISSQDILGFGQNFISSNSPTQIVNFDETNGGRDGYYVYSLNGKMTSVAFVKNEDGQITLLTPEIEALGRSLLENNLVNGLNVTHLQNFSETNPNAIFDFALENSTSSKSFFSILGNTYSNFNQIEKLDLLNKIYKLSDDLYDKNVKTGHSTEISVEEYFAQFRDGHKIGNCKDIACFNLTFAKEVLNIEGISISLLSHEMIVYKLDNGKLYSPDGHGTKKIYSNFYDLLDSRDTLDAYSYISNCDELTSQVQSYFQKKYNQLIVPKGIISYKDTLEGVPEENFGLTSPNIFVLGGDSKHAYGVNFDYLKKAKFSKIEGSFGISGSLTNLSSQAGGNLQIGVSGFSDLKSKVPESLIPNLNLTCGNFTNFLVQKVLNGDKNSLGNFDINSNLYCFVPVNDNIKLVGSFGGIYVENGQLINDEYQTYSYSEFGTKINFSGMNFDIFHKSIIKQSRTTLDLSYTSGDWRISGNLTHSEYKDKVVSEIAPHLQKQLEISFKNKINMSISDEGEDLKVLFSADIPFEAFWK